MERAQGHRYGWTINPVLPDLAPLVWNDYIDNRSEVSLLAGFSGAGYVNPEVMDAAGLQAYLQATGRYMDRTGLRTILVDWRDLVWNTQVATLYYRHLPLSMGCWVSLWAAGNIANGGVQLSLF